MAVYDKRVLDRANQFIDETINPVTGATIAGAIDWNGAAQLSIRPWTKWDDNASVYGAVAYSNGCADWVEHFNADMDDQLTAIRATIPAHPNTIAPNNNWDSVVLDTDTLGYVFSNEVVNTVHYQPRVINNVTYYPYKPGWTNYRMWTSNDYTGEHVIYSAGVDCSGFLERCVSYADNQYQLGERLSGDEIISGTWQANASGERLTWCISAKDMQYHRHTHDEIGTLSWEVTNRNLLVPGDILFRSHAEGDAHVVIISKITYPTKSRTITGGSANVVVIEATAGQNQEWHVMNTQKWSILGNNYTPRRLKINN
jgi:hypothetical protein